MPKIPENGQKPPMNAAQVLHTTARFVPPNTPKSDKGGKLALVAVGSFIAALVCSVLWGSAGVFLPAWGVGFLLGYGMFVEGE
jgi:hypothetical protein